MQTHAVKRALVLAGGGIKAGYQGGCLQVLLDEVGREKLPFHHIDAASGGCFNAAMICSGKSGTEIADAWREMNPFDLVSFNVPELRKLLWARSIATLDALRTKAFVRWSLDFDKIRGWDAEACPVTFNYFNFTTKSVVALLNTELDADYLCACVALIMWFPPVEKNGQTLVDAVFATDANLWEVRRRGPDEVWAIWSVANQPTIRSGVLAQYFHILEQSADANFFAGWKALDEPNITRHLIRQEVPIHYLFNFSQDRMAAAVDLGVADMRRYCRDAGLLPAVYCGASPPPRSPVKIPAPNVRFSERLSGFYFTQRGERFQTHPLELDLTIETGNLDLFVREPHHRGRVASGAVTGAAFGGSFAVTQGSVELFVDERSDDAVILPGNKRMRYTLRFRASDGKPYLFDGTKYVVDGPGKNLWRDTTTLYFRLLELDDADPTAQTVHGAGIVRLTPREFVRQLQSFRTAGTANPPAALAAIARFFGFFLRHCWDVYARDALDYAPF